MCYLLTIGTRESHVSVEALLGRDQLLVVRPSRNSSLRSVFPQDDRLFDLTSGHCSCDMVIEGTQRSVEDQRAKLQARYDKKGWSQAKIARALTDWQTVHERQLEARAAPKEQLWTLLQRLASRPGGLRVFVHFYSGQFDSEDIRARGEVRVAADRLVDAGVIAEDTLTEIVP